VNIRESIATDAVSESTKHPNEKGGKEGKSLKDNAWDNGGRQSAGMQGKEEKYSASRSMSSCSPK